jgi:DNA polymerase V
MTKLKIFGLKKSQSLKIPLSLVTVPAGFPTPADEFIEKKLDLNELLIKHPAATFFVRVSGNSMINAEIHSGDILIVDKSLRPANGTIVVAIINGEFTVKRIIKEKNKIYLQPENDEFQALEITEENDFIIWGVVTNIIHQAN